MCAQVLDRQLSRGMSASDSAKVIRHGNTLPNSPRGRLANPPLQQIIQRATAILEVALLTIYLTAKSSDSARSNVGLLVKSCLPPAPRPFRLHPCDRLASPCWWISLRPDPLRRPT